MPPANLRRSTIPVTGFVEPQFEDVRKQFLANFESGKEIGAAVAVYQCGKLVVGLAAGTRDGTASTPYSCETLQPVFSVSKGNHRARANMLVDRGQLDVEASVVRYWPEFAQANKSEIPVRWLLTHQSGVLGLDRRISQEQLLDWNLVVQSLAAQAPDWKPGTLHGNHSLTYGFLVGEVIRRVTGLSAGQYLAREIAGPLHADLFIGLPKNEEPRVSPVQLPEGVENAVGLGFLLPTEWCPLGGPGSFGTAGFGGSRARANPELELAFVYTPNLCSLGHFSSREAALSRAVTVCAKRLSRNP